jgi:hypothetical protein
MKETAVQKIDEGIKKRTSKDNWFKWMILRDGAKFHNVTIDAQKSQQHELREDQVRDVARFLNLPPNKLGLSDSVSYNSEEQREIGYRISCLNHWMCATTGECRIKLLTKEQKQSGSHYIEHNLTKALEIDVKTMNEVLNIQRAAEVISADEWRRKINLNKRPDGKGGEYVNPNTKSNTATPAEPEKTKPAKNVTETHRFLLVDAINRMARRVSCDAKKSAKSLPKLQQWIDAGAVEHRQIFNDALSPAMHAWCAVFGGDPEPLLCDMSGRFFASILDMLNPFLESKDPAAKLVERIETACQSFEDSISTKLTTAFTGA